VKDTRDQRYERELVMNVVHESAPSDSQVVLRRLIMVATSAWEIPLDSDNPPGGATPGQRRPAGHDALLRRLLGTVDGGDAWIGRDQVSGAAQSGEGAVTYVKQGATATTLIDGLTMAVREQCQRAKRAADARQPGYGAASGDVSMRELRHRVVMDAAQFQAVTRIEPSDRRESPVPQIPGDPLPYFVAWDFRFDFYLGRPLCHLSLSVWSAVPLHERYRPPEWADAERPQSISAPDTYRYRTLFQMILDRAIALLHEHLDEAELLVYGRRQILPLFWVAVPANRTWDTATDEDRRRLIDPLAHTFLDLGSAADCVATSSTVDGQFLVLRRFRQGFPFASAASRPLQLGDVLCDGAGAAAGGRTGRPAAPVLSRAHYLIVPGTPVGAALPADDDPIHAYRVQEDRTAVVITTVTDLEARAASQLHEVLRDLEIWRNHLDVYDAVVERAAFLWDGLSTHMLTRRGRSFGRVHRAVELVHQILLQGVGDLAHLTNRARECVERIEDATDELGGYYDDVLTERHDEPGKGLRSALTRVGLVDRAAQQGHQTVQEASRLQALYNDLLSTIGCAFDERRVRESDAIQKLSCVMGFVVAMIGVVTVLDATVNMKPGTNAPGSPAALPVDWPWLSPAGAWTSWGIGAVLVVAVVYAALRGCRLGRLGSRRLRRLYDGGRGTGRGGGLWRFLDDTSTDALNQFAGKHPAEDPDSDETWAALDDQLCRRFAALWDEAGSLDNVRFAGRPARDIRAQSRRIEQWGLQALLLTERARRLYPYRLPRLACLYRGCAQLGNSFLRPQDMPEIPSMISFNDFAMCLKGAGYDWRDVSTLDTWLQSQRLQTARDLLGDVEASLQPAAPTAPSAVAVAIAWRPALAG
jgi:hypothetical protein